MNESVGRTTKRVRVKLQQTRFDMHNDEAAERKKDNNT